MNLIFLYYFQVLFSYVSPVNDTLLPAQAHTRFHGIQMIETSMINDCTYILEELRDGTRIRTLDAKNQTIEALTQDFQFPPAMDNLCSFEDADNVWDNANERMDEIATDVHWGIEQTFDYFAEVHDWRGMDGVGGDVTALVHLGEDWDEAFHLPPPVNILGFGDGGPLGPNVTLDVVAHEYTHGVIHHAAGLLYIGETSVLDEGLADIFGTIVKIRAQLDFIKDPWVLAEQLGGFRSFSDPKSLGQPDTYKGQNWYSGNNEAQFAHHNNGILNYWFYLLAEGGQGVNDNQYQYAVTAIGIENIEQIIFQTLINHLSLVSTIADFANGTISISEDMFGKDATQTKSIIEAWRAVGVTDLTTSTSDISNYQVSFSWDGDALNIDLGQKKVNHLAINIYDIMGRMIFTRQKEKTAGIFNLSTGYSPTGIYVISLQMDDNRINKKVFIQNL